MKQRRQFLCSEMFHITEKDKSGSFPVSLSNGATTPAPPPQKNISSFGNDLLRKPVQLHTTHNSSTNIKNHHTQQ